MQNALGAALVHVTGPGIGAADAGTMPAGPRPLPRGRRHQDPQFIAEWNLWHVYYAAPNYAGAQSVGQPPDRRCRACSRIRICAASVPCRVGRSSAAPPTTRRHWPARSGAGRSTIRSATASSRIHVRRARPRRMQPQSLLLQRIGRLGRPDRARACHEQGLALARRLGPPADPRERTGPGLWLLQLLRDNDRLAARATATIALATEQGFPNYRIDAEILRAWALRATAPIPGPPCD